MTMARRGGGKLSSRHSPSSYTWKGVATWRTQISWKSLFVFAVFVALALTTVTLDEFVLAARIRSVQLVKGLPMAASYVLPERIVADDMPQKMARRNSGLLSVRDIVAFPEEVMLLVDAVGGSKSLKPPSKDSLACRFGKQHSTGIFSAEWKNDERSVLAVRCEHPQQQAVLESKHVTLLLKDSNFTLPSSVEYTTNSSWKPLVYETVTDEDSVLLFAKGLVDSRGRPNNFSRTLHQLHCSFGSDDLRTPVRVIAQEVVRCELPPPDATEQLRGARVSLFVPKKGLLPSVAYFTPPRNVEEKSNEKTSEKSNQITIGREIESSREESSEKLIEKSIEKSSAEKKFHICACTMLWNQARFLREWIMYHGFLGVERWYLYDNNSDDDIEEVLSGLRPRYNVSRHAWPWIKTQEAGFSHCAFRAKPDCDWMLFADVDEFVFPMKDLQTLVYGKNSSKLSSRKGKGSSSASKAALFAQFDTTKPSSYRELYENSPLPSNGSSSVLRKMINRAVKNNGFNVGEVRLLCHNFGPSGLSRAPKDGVMVGYTCRMQWPQRHKSFVLLDALSDSLMNVVHHFALREGYKEIGVNTRIAIINHYKYQAWEVFKAKFVRRVATYVVDWREQTALSNDRAPDLGLEAVEPPDWPDRYCDEADWGLRNFTENTFRHPETNLMPWQSQ